MFDEQPKSTYSTADELDYLNTIGTHGNFRPEQRLELLRGYQAALSKRPRSAKYLDMAKLRWRVRELLSE